MIDLRNIAQQLRLPADQLRIAADLLEQGYQPAFIARYRADETGHLSGSVLWSLKFAMERQHQLDAARHEALAHLGEGVELDDEGRERIERAQSVVDIDVAMRCFRSRRAAKQSGERHGQASQLLEKIIAATDAPADANAWAAEQLNSDAAQGEQLLAQCSRLVATLLAGDTRLMERMRQAVQKRANVRVEPHPEPNAKTKSDKDGAGHPSSGDSSSSGSPDSDTHDHDLADQDAWAHADDDLVGDHHDNEQGASDHGSSDQSAVEPHISGSSEGDPSAAPPVADEPAEASNVAPHGSDLPSEQGSPSEQVTLGAGGSESESGAGPGNSSSGSATNAAESAGPTTDQASTTGEPPISLTFESGKKSREAKLLTGKRKEREKATSKVVAKLTPRQRRRRWLSSVLQPFKALKKPLHRLTAYQMLMLGRGQRSQLIKVELDYDRRQLINMARDVFVNDSHPFAKWFAQACDHALTAGLYAKVESDALAEHDEMAQQQLLEAATDQLRVSLLQRPVKGHRILIVDTVGPNASCVAIIDARGKCLATAEVVCSSQPSVVSQNVIMLGELVHKHKVTLVALSNGPARRFLVHTVAELMKQSATSNLRWTMVDRGGAEAYATSRHASVELPQLNRRFRAAVWLGRRLQDPLGELLKLDTTRLRLGSYQRELPQDPLKRLVTATLSDCLCVKGVDARYASEQQFSYVPGVSPEIANKLAEMAAKREFTSREAMTAALPEWSETGKRQALGFLRIFQSPQTLDGTLIHPDDYRLAMRLIENTDLAQPPAAPDGWQPPKIKAPKAPRNSPASTTVSSDPSTTDSADASDPAATTDQAIAELSSGDLVAPESTSAAMPQASASESAGVEVALTSDAPQSASAGDTAQAAGEDHDAQPNDAQPNDAGANATGASDSNALDVGTESSAGDAAAEPMTASRPEYSEEVLEQQALPPALDVEKLARGWQVGRAKLAWLASCLASPFGDSRDNRPPVPMLTAVPALTDLQPGMSVYAIVVGVAEFGAFVELGPDCGGLIHISRLSPSFVEDPHQAVQIGDLIQAWVVSVDVEKKRVALTALSPDQQRRQAEAQREDHARHENRGARSGQSGQQQSGQQSFARNEQAGRAGGARPQSGQDRGGNRGGQSGPGGGRGERPGGGGKRGDRAGAPGGGNRARGARRDGGETTGRPVIVKSKKPSAPITEAMKKGQEPLRSFSDLLQFYEVKRTDPPSPPVAAEPERKLPPDPATPTPPVEPDSSAE